MTSEEEDRIRILAELLGISREEAADLIANVSLRKALREHLQQPAGGSQVPDVTAMFGAFLEALNTNTAATRDVLGRLDTLLDENGTPTFQAPKEVLEEGEYLKAQLAGVVTTAAPGNRFKDAAPRRIAPGLDVLAAAVKPR